MIALVFSSYILQNRAKGAARRPPSRRNLRQSGSDPAPPSTDLFSDTFSSSDVFLPPSPVTAKPVPKPAKKPATHPPQKEGLHFEADLFSPPPAKTLTDKLEREVAKETGIFGSNKGQSKLSVTFDDDLFGGGGDSVITRDTDELFPAVAAKPKAAVKEPTLDDDLFGGARRDTTPGKPVEVISKKTPDIFEAPPENVFASKTRPASDEVDLFAPAKDEKMTVKPLDDIFADVSNTFMYH